MFDVPLDQQGSDFQLQVWQALKTIPYGHTAEQQQDIQRLRDQLKGMLSEALTKQ